jgi:hemerythrin-like domain-containing protein
MSNVVMLLQIDHRNMAKLLDLIQQQATNMTRRDPVNYPLLETAFAYLSSYPDRCHHPKEDLVYRKLLSRYPEMAVSLEDLVTEHEKLAQLTRNLVAALGESRLAQPAMTGRLADQLMEFLGLYRHHMAMEDQHFFPVALQRLSADDFEEIDFRLFDQPDPLLDRDAEGMFAQLREEVTRLGAVEKTSDDRDEATLLGTIQDIAAFNEVMRRSGNAVCLVRSSQEGYELEHNGKMLVHIPACSESRAAWCAYFYWKARRSETRPIDRTYG